jgi:pimeloyl-ACP methyl ester carboxylesterase
MLKSPLGEKLSRPPLAVTVGTYQITYRSFTSPRSAFRTPLIVLTSSLQSANHFYDFILKTAGEWPVYLVDLPGQGENTDFGEGLELVDLADLLEGFLNRLGISKIQIMGFSHMATTAFLFAQSRPDKVSKVILAGATTSLRASVRALLEENIHSYSIGEFSEFAHSAPLSLSNWSLQEGITHSRALVRMMSRTLEQHSNEASRMALNIKRMLNAKVLTGMLEMPTLIISGEWDRFTTANEGFQLSKRCLQGSFAMIKDCDHFASYENGKVFNKVVARYLMDEPLGRMVGVEVIEKDNFPFSRLQLVPRWKLDEIAFLDSGNGVFVPINIIDINSHGCRLFTSFNSHHSLRAGQKKFVLRLQGPEVAVEVLIFDREDGKHFKGVFKHRSLERTRAFEGLVGKLSEGKQLVA